MNESGIVTIGVAYAGVPDAGEPSLVQLERLRGSQTVDEIAAIVRSGRPHVVLYDATAQRYLAAVPFGG